MFILRSKLN